MIVEDQDLSTLIFYAMRGTNTDNVEVTKDIIDIITKYEAALSKKDIFVMTHDIMNILDDGKRGSDMWRDLLFNLR